MTVVASGKAKDGYAGSPKLDYDDDDAYDARARLTHMWNDRRTTSAAGRQAAELFDERLADKRSKWG